jgi:N-acetyl-gamma-glutamyl-phosphate reductase
MKDAPRKSSASGPGFILRPKFASLGEVRAQAAPLDALFLCLPHDSGVDLFELVEWAQAQGTKVFDVGDGLRKQALGGAAQFAYGIPELFGADIAKASVVACAGCYPTSVLLALAPLLEAGALCPEARIIVDAKSGTTGAGRRPQTHLLLAEAAGNFAPYAPGRTHRHVAEMELAAAKFVPHGDGFPKILFTPHLLPVARGLLSTLHLRLASGFRAGAVRALLQERYVQAPLVDVLDAGRVASLAHVVGSAGAVLSIHGAEDDDSLDVVLVSALDNLMKGASSQAIQNFNLVFGHEPLEGLHGRCA